MHNRQNALNIWLKTLFAETPFKVAPLAGDASFRCYYRIFHGDNTYVVMDAPPDKEMTTPFITIAQALANCGIHTPHIHAVDQTNGFVLLEDLGDLLLLGALNAATADKFYQAAMTTLLEIQQCPLAIELPVFGKSHMLQELALFRDWFLDQYLAITLNEAAQQCLQDTFNWLADKISLQPQVFIHRDYHSRNLIIVDQSMPPSLGVIDFQDAMRGPFAYDLVSLLKDCYIQWPREQIVTWLTYFHSQLDTNYSLADFTHAFDLCGLQRHLKVLGIFCRLHLRDKKPAYLRDLPLTFNYMMACLEGYEELQPFYDLMQRNVVRPFMEKTK